MTTPKIVKKCSRCRGTQRVHENQHAGKCRFCKQTSRLFSKPEWISFRKSQRNGD